MADRMAQVGEQRLEGWADYGGRPVNIAAEMMQMALEVISQTMFTTSVAQHMDQISHALRPSGHCLDYPWSCSIVHWLGDLSGRNLINFVPWRKRSSVTWSKPTSTTIFGKSGSHCVDRSVDQRLGAPGAFPVKPGSCISFS